MERKFLYISLILTVGIGIGSLISLSNAPISAVKISDKTIHITAYFLVSLSWLLTFRNHVNNLKINRLIFGLILAYGIIIELLQGNLTSKRQFEFFDILANLVGISTAFLLFIIVFKKKRIK